MRSATARLGLLVLVAGLPGLLGLGLMASGGLIALIGAGAFVFLVLRGLMPTGTRPALAAWPVAGGDDGKG